MTIAILPDCGIICVIRHLMAHRRNLNDKAHYPREDMMTLTECKQLMNWYRNDAEAGIVQFNWRTTARWSLRHRWSQEENVKLQAALQDATKRAEAAGAALAERDTPCRWRSIPPLADSYATGCNHTLKKGVDAFCPECGHPVEVQP